MLRSRDVMWLYFRYVKSRKLPGAVVFAAICLSLTVLSALALCAFFFASSKIDWPSRVPAIVTAALLEESLLLLVFATAKTDARAYRFFRIIGMDVSRSPGFLTLELCSATIVPFLCNLAALSVVFVSMRLGGPTVVSVVAAELCLYALSLYGIGRWRIRALKKNPVRFDADSRPRNSRRSRMPILSRSLDMKLFVRAVRIDLNFLGYTIGFMSAFVFSIRTTVSLPPEAAFAGGLFGSAFMLVLVDAMIQEYMGLINRNFFLLQPLSLVKYFFAALRPVLLCVSPVSLGWLLFLFFRSPQGLLASLPLHLFAPVISFNIGVVFGNTLKSGLLSIGALAALVILCCVNIFLMMVLATVIFLCSYANASFSFKNYAWRK